MKKFYFYHLSSLVLGLSLTSNASANHIALLVGINDYPSPNQLEGAVNDVQAIKKTLIDKWQFSEKDIVTLINKDATFNNIINELNRLKTRSKANDQVFIYFSGHGTSSIDKGLKLALPSTSGAFIPVDFPLSGKHTLDSLQKTMIVGKWHLQPILKELEQDRSLFIAMDSCYSGNAVRALNQYPFHKRYMPVAFDDAFSDNLISTTNTKSTDNYPYKNVVFLSAASDAEQADDISGDNLSFAPTLDGKPHGAMTDALLRVLNGTVAEADKNHDKQLSYNEIHQAVRSLVQKNHNHTPMLLPSLPEDGQNITDHILFKQKDIILREPTSSTPKLQLKIDSPTPAVLEKLLNRPELNFSNTPDFIVSQTTKGLDLKKATGETILANSQLSDIKNRLASQIWLQQHLARLSSTESLNLQTNKHERGNNFIANDTLAFMVKSSANAYLVLINIAANGEISVLYPSNTKGKEGQKIPAQQLVTIPSSDPQNWIRVVPPFGIDQVVAFALPQKPRHWDELPNMVSLLPNTPQLVALDELLTSQKDIAWQQLELRSFPSAP